MEHGLEEEVVPSAMSSPEAKVASNPHHHSVCMVSTQYPTHGKGTGVLVDYEGYLCIVAGAHLLPSPVAASKALVYFVLPGMLRSVKIPLQPEALFELLGRDKSIAITACDLPTIPPIAIPPALPAPAEYARTVRRFSRLGRLHSPARAVSRATVEGPDYSDRTNAGTSAAVSRGLTDATKRSGHRRRHRNAYAGRDRNRKFEETASIRTRRGAVIPGTKAYRHPNNPDPVELFSITVGKGGVILMEMVAHAHGRGKRAYRTAVLGQGVGQTAEGRKGGRGRGEVGREGAYDTAMQKAGGASGERWGEVEVEGRGIGGGVFSAAAASAGGEPRGEEGVLGTGGGGGRLNGNTNNMRNKGGGGEGGRGDGWTGNDNHERERRMPTEDGHRANIAVVVPEQEALGGMHGAPVFLGGQLFGFAIQERVGEHVTEVIPASAFGLLPPLLDEQPSPSIDTGDKISDTSGPHGATLISTTGSSSEGVEEDQGGGGRGKLVRGGGGGGAEGIHNAMLLLLEKMVHLFRHGTPLSLELELNRVGGEALRALQTPDGRSLVHLAAMSETLVPLEFVHRRLLMDVAFAEVPETGNTGLHLAAYCGRVNCLGYMVSHGGDVLKKNRHGQTPAMLAVLTRRTEVLKWLLQNTKSMGNAPENVFPEELLDMVEDMDEAAVYGSPMYRLLDDAFNGEKPESEESELSDIAQGETPPAADEAKTAAQLPMSKSLTDETAEEGATGGEADATIDFDRAWELYRRGEMSAGRVLAVLKHIHGEVLGASWPLVLSALPSDEPHLVEALEVAKRGADRERVAAKTLSREEARKKRASAAKASSTFTDGDGTFSSPGSGDERACFRWTTKKYLRGSISAEEFYGEMVGTKGAAGKVEETMVAKVARGMPEDKAWGLMEAHRKWRHEERLSKKRFRKTRNADGLSGTKIKIGDAQAETGESDDSSVATIFSLGASVDSCGLSTSAEKGVDLDRVVARYKAGRVSAAELKRVLAEAFGTQIECILPAVLATLPHKKRRELTKLCHTDSGMLRKPKALPPKAPTCSDKIQDIPQNLRGKVPGGAASSAVTATAREAALAAGGASHGPGLARPERADPTGGGQQRQDHQQVVSGVATRGGKNRARGQKPRTGGLRQGPGDDDDGNDNDDVVGSFTPKANSPFTTRASAWAGKKEDPQDQEPGDEKGQRDAGLGRNTRSVAPGGVLGEEEPRGQAAAAAGSGRRASKSGSDGGGDDDGDGDDDGAEVATKEKRKRDSLASDAQRLTSEFAAGRLTAPHFFGAMMEDFGEERLVAALPGILKILPEDKAAELKAFTSEAGGKAGAATKARRKQKEVAEKQRHENERQEKENEEMERKQAGEASKEKANAKRAAKDAGNGKATTTTTTAAAAKAAAAAAADDDDDDGIEGKGGIKGVQNIKKNDDHNASTTGDDGATAEDAPKGGKKRKKTKGKGGDGSATAAPAPAPAPAPTPTPAPTATPPDQGKRGTKKTKKVKTKKSKIVGDSSVAAEDEDDDDDVDVEGGELFEMTGAERKRYGKAFSKLSPDDGAISPAKAASTLAKSGLPRDALKKIWEMADVERDEKLNKEEWAVAMHLVVCTTVRKLPLPARLPKCLRTPSSNQPQPQQQQQQQQQRGQQEEPAAAGSSTEKRQEKNEQQHEQNAKKAAAAAAAGKQKHTPPTADLKRATKEFKNGGMRAEDFLPVLQEAFGEKELAKMWPKLLPTLPPGKAEELAKTAGVDFEADKRSSREGSPRRQAGLKEATASFKKGGMTAMEYHESVLKQAFGDELPEMLPKILKALPPDRASALKTVIEADADEVRRLAEEAPQLWAMSFEDRRVYDNAFVKLDKDRDGFLSSAEARPMLKKAVGDRLAESQMRDVWRMADIDGDGRLTREEWAIAYHIVRCVVKRQMELPSTLPEVLGATAGGRLPSV